MPKLSESIESYLFSLDNDHFSTLTFRNYKHYLERFLEFVISRGNKKPGIKHINLSLVKEYSNFLPKIGLSLKTQGFHLIALRSFLRWVREKGYNSLEPGSINIPKAQSAKLKFLTGDQIDRLLNAPSLSTIQGKRDKAILEVLFSTGLRISELVKLNRDKLDLEEREFGIMGNGGRTRIVFLSNRATDWIKKYLSSRKDHFKPLFLRHKGKIEPSVPDEKTRLTPRSIQRMVKKYVRKINLPVDASPHTIRHSYAADLLMAGADIRSVQKMLGHKNISTTQIYTHVTNKQLRDIHEAFHGRGK